MIRDPSDGSVRAPSAPTHALKPSEATMPPETIQNASAAISGLPTDIPKGKDFARIEKSREWLQNYRKGKQP